MILVIHLLFKGIKVNLSFVIIKKNYKFRKITCLIKKILIYIAGEAQAKLHFTLFGSRAKI